MRDLSEAELAAYLKRHPQSCPACGQHEEWDGRVTPMVAGSFQKQWADKRKNPDMILLTCRKCSQPVNPSVYLP